jgi:hypothetical protein
MKVIDDAREAISGAAAGVSGAMRVAIVSCVLSVLAIFISLSVVLGLVMPLPVSRETSAGG